MNAVAFPPAPPGAQSLPGRARRAGWALSIRTLAVLALLAIFASSAAQCDDGWPLADAERDGSLVVVFPTETTELVGGQSLRVTVSLADRAGQPVVGATVQAELCAPDGSTFAALSCADESQGRYLADLVRLPFRGTQGTWRVTARATWGDGRQAHAEREFRGRASYSERLEALYGFWLELPDLFPYNVPQADDPAIKYWPYDDGNGGMVILANSFPQGGLATRFVILDVHWRQDPWPADEAAAAAYVAGLYGPHHQKLNYTPTILTVESTTFRGWPAWFLTGRWGRGEAYGLRPEDLIEWTVFRCPGSDWLWTILVDTSDSDYLDDLRAVRDTFECATSQ